MKSHVRLWGIVLKDFEDRCCTSASNDLRTVAARVEGEGFSFLTITLPNFGSDFQKSLDLGYVSHDHFVGFRRRGGLPLFLGGFLDLIFDRGTGRLLSDPSIDAIFAVRQLTMLFGKVALECSDARTRRAFERFIQNEKDIRTSDKEVPEKYISGFDHIGVLLWSDVLSKLDQKIYLGVHGSKDPFVPRHGPGATADKLKGNRKFAQREYTERLDKVFPVLDYLVPNARHHDRLDQVLILEPGQERPVKVIPVPKTLKTPRLIAIEPTCMQYMQQAVDEQLRNLIEEDDISSRFISFRDQEPNRLLAMEGSRSGLLATLDLSDASDLVSNQHVRRLLRRNPLIAEAVDACRSRKADVPGYGVIRLAKFASMGSALTFPIETMVFLTLVFVGIQNALSRQLTSKDIRSFEGQVRVYGDDIVAPVEYVHEIVAVLEAFGLRVNASKSFWTGKFRESCGGDYYDGVDVTPVRLRHLVPSRFQNASAEEIISTVSFRNQSYWAGLWGVARYMDESVIGPGLNGHYPAVHPTSAVLGRESVLGYDTPRTCRFLHRPLVRGYVVHSTIPTNSINGVDALEKFFLKRGEQPFADRNHLMRSGRPQAVDIKLAWAPPY